MELEIREITKQDISETLKLIKESGEYDEQFLWIKPHQDMVKDSVTASTLLTLVVVVENKVIGVCTGWVFEPYSHIWYMVVHPKYRMKGISKELLDYWYTFCDSKIITAETWCDNNETLITHWLKLGFSITGYVSNKFGDGDNYIHLIKI